MTKLRAGLAGDLIPWHLAPLDLLHLLHRPHRRSPDKLSLSIGAVAFIVAFRRRSEKPLSSEGPNLTYVHM